MVPWHVHKFTNLPSLQISLKTTLKLSTPRLKHLLIEATLEMGIQSLISLLFDKTFRLHSLHFQKTLFTHWKLSHSNNNKIVTLKQIYRDCCDQITIHTLFTPKDVLHPTRSAARHSLPPRSWAGSACSATGTSPCQSHPSSLQIVHRIYL